jgi:hypothetical protein
MIPQFDIFRMKKSEYVWLEATMTLADEEARFTNLEPQKPVDTSSSIREPAAESC